MEGLGLYGRILLKWILNKVRGCGVASPEVSGAME
jgi:hypothetical protein